MATISVRRELRTHLLHGPRYHHRTGFPSRRGQCPAALADISSWASSMSSSGSEADSTSHACSEPNSGQPAKNRLPFRQELKAQGKALKAAGRLKPPSHDRQAVRGWELTVGLEIHAQLNTRYKLFSSASPPSPTDDPNTRVALFDLAMPGSQPVFQINSIIPAVRAALALKCNVQSVSSWDRKHYFWWDQPAGYQITQYYEPFAKDGHMTLYERDGIASQDGKQVTVGIKQVQMEQDTAKTITRPDGIQWVDFNRVGVPLIEIITKPEIRHPKTAAALVRKVQMYLNSVDACISGMEAGGLRADVNVSVRRQDHPFFDKMPLGQKTEIKNLSSFKAVEDAIIAERDRQISLLMDGGTVLGETRGWSVGASETTRLRGKEGQVDYRYMPDPDLRPVIIGKDVIAHLDKNLGVLPDAEIDELVAKYGFTEKDAMSLIQLDGGGRLEYYYNVVQRLESQLGRHWNKDRAVLAGNWVLHELGRLTSERNAPAVGGLGMTPAGECACVPARHLADILQFLATLRITSRVAKELLFAVFRGDLNGTTKQGYTSVEEAIDKENLWFDSLSREQYVDLAIQAIENEDRAVKKFRALFASSASYPTGQVMFFVGKMMRIGPANRIDPQVAQEVIKTLLEKVVDQ